MEGTAMAILSNGGQLLTDEYRLLHNVGPGITDLRDDLDTMTALLIMHSETAGAGDDDGAAVDHFVRVWMKPAPRARLRRRRLHRPLQAPDQVPSPDQPTASSSASNASSGPSSPAAASPERSPPSAPAPSPSATATPASAAASTATPSAAAGHLLRLQPLPLLLRRVRSMTFLSIAISSASRTRRKPWRRSWWSKTTEERIEISRRAMVLSIVGFGGLGMTTLAKEVCRRLEEEFPYQAMVSVSQAFEAGRDLEELCKRACWSRWRWSKRRMREEPKMMVRRHCWQQMLVSRTTTKIRRSSSWSFSKTRGTYIELLVISSLLTRINS
ncbi:hypothetical protein HU200_016122 [Digitaria exilis]|uniref:NB-ARC domain-containing protein n=1 Tax=Digitaria exilis TaxID=1010633 RepID=A0A835F9A1_9POAL|nr:hypothetical protein HU200_016122 [Digitaria exilis]